MRRKEISQLSTCQKRQKAHSTGIHQYPQAAINFYHKLLAPASTNTPPAHNTSLTSPQIPPPPPPVLVIQTTFLSNKPHIFIKQTPHFYQANQEKSHMPMHSTQSSKPLPIHPKCKPSNSHQHAPMAPQQPIAQTLSTGIHQYPQAAINFYHKLLAPASTNTPPAHNTSLTSPQIPPPTPPVLVIQTTFLSNKPHIFIKQTPHFYQANQEKSHMPMHSTQSSKPLPIHPKCKPSNSHQHAPAIINTHR